ncbi:MAG: hypothetical protein E5W81_03150 [Mesorhizobium sp.]|nr:MAG: hypothetical protein E5W81_03150 [Mesorhizobium sp.]
MAVATRNARLAAMHTLARFLISEHPNNMDTLQLVVTLPFKRARGWHLSNISKSPELRSVLARIDRRTPSGQRDCALFSLMFDTDARVQEILNPRICDLRLVSPCPAEQKGLSQRPRHTTDPDRCRYLLRKHVDTAAGEATTLAEKSIHHRSLRHTTAIHLVKAGVDIATISQWLGHSGLNVTMRYARAGIDMKRQALEQVFPDVMSSAKDQTIIARWRDVRLAAPLVDAQLCGVVSWEVARLWALALSAPHLSAVHVVAVEEQSVHVFVLARQDCPYCGRLALAELVRNPAPDQA